ncbi:MAG TPA: hypothetical protein VN368_00465 [Candidatus Methylomirabilis sp.]|nr:hypothetical protein [Candidatus Methylomirabilis sp.]
MDTNTNIKRKIIVRRNGNSNVIAIPPILCESLDISKDSILDIEQIEGGKILITPLMV